MENKTEFKGKKLSTVVEAVLKLSEVGILTIFAITFLLGYIGDLPGPLGTDYGMSILIALSGVFVAFQPLTCIWYMFMDRSNTIKIPWIGYYKSGSLALSRLAGTIIAIIVLSGTNQIGFKIIAILGLMIIKFMILAGKRLKIN